MKSPLAKARDKWLLSEDGRGCREGQTSGQYLQNRLKRAFIAGADFSAERIKELETYLIEFGDHKPGCLAIATNNKRDCRCGFTQAVMDK